MKLQPWWLAPLFVLAPACLGAPLTAQEADLPRLQSGPKAGAPLGKVQVYAPVGPHKGKTFDAMAIIDKAPGAILFLHEVTRETAAIIRGLDNLAFKFGLFGFRSMTVRLEADRTAAEEQVKRFSRALHLRNPIVVSLDGAEGPGALALNRRATLTLVLCKNGKVHRSLAFTETGRGDLPMLRKAIEEVAGPLPQKDADFAARLPGESSALKKIALALFAETRRLQAQIERMQKNRRGRGRRNRGRRQPPGEQSPGKKKPVASRPASRPAAAPAKDLRQLLQSFTNKTNTDKDVAEIFASIEKRVGDDKGLRLQVAQMFRFIAARGLGTEAARKRAKAFVRKVDGGL